MGETGIEVLALYCPVAPPHAGRQSPTGDDEMGTHRLNPELGPAVLDRSDEVSPLIQTLLIPESACGVE